MAFERLDYGENGRIKRLKK